MGAIRHYLADILDIDVAIDAKGFQGLAQNLSERYGIDHLVYLTPLLPSSLGLAQEPYVDTTYHSSWVDHYRNENYVTFDPVMQLAHKTHLPVDWATIPRQDKRVARFFAEAADHRVGNQGMTLSLRGLGAGIEGYFTLSANASDKEWAAKRKAFFKDIYTLGNYFHARVVERHRAVLPQPVNLTRREQEVILWASEGKTIEDVGVILGISRETVNAHLDQVRRKTQALNTAHAISLLYRQGLLG
jgi:LuxR family transcriptional regulator, quorum-sensing system regulator SinR